MDEHGPLHVVMLSYPQLSMLPSPASMKKGLTLMR